MDRTMSRRSLDAQLGRLGRRVRGIGIVSGLGWGVAAIGLIALAGAWADLVFELSSPLRVAALALAALAGLGLAMTAAWQSGRHAGTPALARRLDQVAAARGEIVAGVDLLHFPGHFGILGDGLAAIAVERAAELARPVSNPLVAPARPLFMPALALALMAGAVATVALVSPRMAQSIWLRFSDPFSDHPPYSSVIFQVEPGDTTVVYGQGVEIRTKTEGAPVDRMELVLEPAGAGPERLPMFPEGNGRWRAAVANVTTAGRYFVRADRGRARSARHRIDLITVPRLTQVRFRVTPPAYTRRSAYEGALPAGGLAGLPGTRVDVWTTSNRPLAGGTLALEAPRATRALALVPTAPRAHEVHGSFEIEGDAKIEVRVLDLAGQRSLDAFSASVSVLRDDRPLIRITEPREVSFATPEVMLPVVLAAEDDFGIKRVQLFRALNGSRASPIDLPLGSESPTRWNDQTYLPLGEYGLRPGDEITLFARVEDNDPAGAKGSESLVVRVRIIPREVFERMVRAREGVEILASKYQEAQRRLEGLADEIDRLQAELANLPPGSQLSSAHEQKLQELVRRARDETAAFRESARHPLPYDIDQNLSRELDSTAGSLDQLGRELEKLGIGTGVTAGAAAGRLAELRDRLAAGRKELNENALAPIEHLARIYPLFEDQARFVELYLRQRDLAERLASLKGRDRADDPAQKGRMRDLEAEQNQIQTALRQVLDDIADHARLLPDDPRLAQLRETALAFAAGVRGSRAPAAMADAATALAAFAGTRAVVSAKEAADILEKFLSQCSDDGKFNQACQGCLRFQPALEGKLGNSIEQMLAAAGLPSPGLKGGPGFGVGAGMGNGMSARQNNLNNVGLYGSLPALVSSARRGSGRSAAGGRGRSDGTAPFHATPETLTAAGASSAAGAAQTAIPAPYRRRVADYFQRIADENGAR